MNAQVAAIAVFSLLAGVTSNAQTVLLNQPYNSGNFTSAQDFHCYDDFTLANGGIINQVNWYGLDQDRGVYGFSVTFWTDNNGLPGTLLSNNSIAGNAGETPTGTYGQAGPNNPIYGYSSMLASPFTAAPGTEYFISIYATYGFVWETSPFGNGGGLQNAYYYPSPFHTGEDFAFSLDGTIVPESNTAVLGVFGAFAILNRKSFELLQKNK